MKYLSANHIRLASGTMSETTDDQSAMFWAYPPTLDMIPRLLHSLAASSWTGGGEVSPVAFGFGLDSQRRNGVLGPFTDITIGRRRKAPHESTICCISDTTIMAFDSMTLKGTLETARRDQKRAQSREALLVRLLLLLLANDDMHSATCTISRTVRLNCVTALRAVDVMQSPPAASLTKTGLGMHGFRSAPLIQRFDAVLAAVSASREVCESANALTSTAAVSHVPGMLVPPKRRAENVAIVVVDPNHTDIDRSHCAVRFQLILCVDERGQPIVA